MVRNLTQLAPLLQRLASLELGLETANAAAGLVALQQLHSLHRLKPYPSIPGRKLRLELGTLRLLPSSLTELHLHIVPALGDDPLANEFPTVCFPDLQRLALHFGAVPLQIKQAEPFEATDALCPHLTWLEVVGPNPCPNADSESLDLDAPANPAEETLSAQFLTRFPAIQTLEIAEGHVRGFRKALEDMPHLVAARLHLEVYRWESYEAYQTGDRSMWLPMHQNLQILQLNLRDVDDDGSDWCRQDGQDYDLSAMPNLIWAMLVGPIVHFLRAIPRSLSKLLLVSNNAPDVVYHFKCDLSSLNLLAFITVDEECMVQSVPYEGPRLFLHEGDPTCKAAFPSDAKWCIPMAQPAAWNSVAEHLTAQVDGHGSHC